MSKKLSYKILAAVLALNAFNLTAAAPAWAESVIIDDNYDGDGYVFGTGSFDNTGDVNGGEVIVNGGKLEIVYGGYTTNGTAENNKVFVNGITDDEKFRSFIGASTENGDAINNRVEVNNSDMDTKGDVSGAQAYMGSASKNIVVINDSTVCYVFGAIAWNNANENYVYINNSTVKSLNFGGGVIGGSAMNGNADKNYVYLKNSTVISGSDDDIGVIGAYATNGNTDSNEIIIDGGSVNGIIASSFIEVSEDGEYSAKENKITLTGDADVSEADFYVSLIDAKNPDSIKMSDNHLILNNWSGTVNSVHDFSDIDFENVEWENGATVLTITGNQEENALANTNINIISFASGSTINPGETMTFIAGTGESSKPLGIEQSNYSIAPTAFTSGVALQGTGIIELDANGNLVFKTLTVQINEQTKLLTQTQAAAAAFVNQGTDLINDSLDVIGRDGTYGVKTFAAVQGNRSKYDVADDLKINGWSVIAGFGAENEHKGGDFAWGVFYENGSGNYRTYNHFNNEFFHGDGSMVYNGGGVAARYENSHGVYTEGSLRAGMLKNEMDNALRDANGSYGCDTESAYYGAHIGVGQIFAISESSDLDVYGKFFHTYTEGDTVMIAGDKFDFDSITSDRLRVGARLTTNKANAFSAYYGLAYEYEFNGDADMTAQGIKAPTESFGGSSVLAELGLNYQPTPDSPWNFDLNLRGYAGERKGGSFNVQVTYTF